MKRVTKWFAGSLLLVAPFVFGQESQRLPVLPEDALTQRQLIAWSRLQEPQPAPQPLPPRNTPVPQPDQQDQHPSRASGSPETDASPVPQSFAGRIVRDGSRYVLTVANASYQLVEQDDAIRYENHEVRVFGTLVGRDTMRVTRIELAP
jgi:Protein of unknown function (DUF5818)